MNIPRIVVAGFYSEGGKTTLATGLMGAFMKKGLRVQAFKAGQDPIDATYHAAVTNKPSRHLDAWLTSSRTVLEIFERASKDADIAVIEGGMGLFEGVTRVVDGVEAYEKTAQVARILRAPVIIVLDFYSMRVHIADIFHIFLNVLDWFDKRVKVKGVVLNNFESEQQAEWAKRAITLATKVPVLGMIPRNEEIRLPTRRGGLIPVPERETLKITLSKLVGYVGERINVDTIYEIAASAEDLPDIKSNVYPPQWQQKRVRLAVASDEAFSFLNKDNVDLLEANGAEIALFSPIHDKELPPGIDGLYLPGGFPDMLAKQLAANQIMRKSIMDATYDGMPTYSEHGGSLYLTKSITNFNGLTFPMIGALSGEALMEPKLQALDFTVMETINDNLLSQKGFVIRGHEFHFSRIMGLPKDARFAYKMRIGRGIDGEHDGLMENEILALLGHIQFAFDARFAANFVEHSEHYRRK